MYLADENNWNIQPETNYNKASVCYATGAAPSWSGKITFRMTAHTRLNSGGLWNGTVSAVFQLLLGLHFLLWEQALRL